MRSILKLRTLVSRRSGVVMAAAMPVLASTSLWAQDAPAAESTGGGGDGGMNYFQMFFLSDDAIGLLIIWLLVLMSMGSIGYSSRLLLKYRKATLIPDETASQLKDLLEQKKYREAIEYASEDYSYLGRLADAALSEATNGYAAMERAIEEAGDAETSRIFRPIEYLNVLGNISPMIGLFGTVYGMILAFQGLVAAGGSPDPAELAGGISTALVTTLWGLVVAIPALAAYAMVRNRIDAMTSEGLLIAEDIIAPFKPGRKKAATQRSSKSED